MRKAPVGEALGVPGSGTGRPSPSPRSASSTATSARARSTRSGVLPPAARAAADAGDRARRALAGVLVARPDRERQVPRLRHARRQPRRGRHPRAPRAHRRRDARGPAVVAARALRRGAPLRRRHHHAGDLGARGRRGARGRDARRWPRWVVPIAVVCLSSSSPSSGAARRASARSSARSCCSGSSTIAVLGARRGRAEPGHPARAQPVARACGFFVDHGTAGFLVLGSVVLAVTGGEALYADMGHFGAADPDRLVRARVPGAAPQLLRPGRASAPSARGRPEPLLPPGAAAGSSTRWSSSRRSPPSSRRRR